MDTESPSPSPAKSRTTILKVLAVPVVVIAIVIPTILLGSTSKPLPPGKVAGVENAVNAYLNFSEGLLPSSLNVSASLSSADPYWARFLVAPKRPNATFAGATGFAHWVNDQWFVVAYGNASAGCPLKGATVVPKDVLRSFHVVCTTN